MEKEDAMLSTFLKVLGALTLLGSGDAKDACLITLLLKVLPVLLLMIAVIALATCNH